MVKKKRLHSDNELISLSWPIFVELFLRVIIGNINVLMISKYSESAVAAVGASNQILNLTVFIFGFVSVGTQIIIAQLIGAKRRERIQSVITTSLTAALVLGFLISAIFIFFSTYFLQWMQLSPELVEIGASYLKIFGGGMFLTSLTTTMIAIMRSHGFTKPALLVPLFASIIAVIGNFFALYGPFGLPVFGVTGMAVSSIVGNSVGLVIAIHLLHRHVRYRISFTNFKDFSFKNLKSVLSYGLPSSGEALSYQAAQVVVTTIVATLGQDALVAKSYVNAITQFVSLAAASLSQGTQIMIGRHVGAGEINRAYHRGIRSVKIGVILSVVITFLIWLFITPIMGVFTSSLTVLLIAKQVFLVDIFLEAGRAVNMILVGALNASGDVKYPLICSIIVLWIISLPFSYLLAIKFGLGLVGVWLAYAIDEILRSLLMLYRWKSDIWKSKFKLSD